MLEYVDIDSNHISCGDFASFISEGFLKGSDQRQNFREQHSGKCCNLDTASEDCSLCGDSSLDRDARVFFAGDELSCHELESNIMSEKSVSEQCETNQRLYSGMCCIQAPENSCHLCNLNGSRLNMKNNIRVSSAYTCLDIHHLLYAQHEASSEHCIEAQGQLSDLCCESSNSQTTPLHSFGAALSINMQNPEGVFGRSSPPTQKPSSEFMSWYYAGSMSSNASSIMTSFRLFYFAIVGLMIII